MHTHLFTPGPVEVSHEVRSAGAVPLVGHRSEAYYSLLGEVVSLLKGLMHASQPVITLPSSGTGALEALAVNLLDPGDVVVSISCGAFGERFREIAARRGADVIPVDIPRGRAATPDDVRRSLDENPCAAAILLTHNETSTGVLTDIRACTTALPEGGPLVLVDAVSSLGAVPCYPEEWRVDGLASCSQKGLMAPPGIGVIALSERGWRRADSRPSPSYYFDLPMHRRFLEKPRPQNPYTPPVSLLFSLAEALRCLEKDGFERRFAAVERTACTFEAACEAMGMPLFVKDQGMRSPAVTAIAVPGGRAGEMKRALAELGVDAAEGQGKEPVLRVAHYTPGGWPKLCLIAGSLYAAGRACGMELAPDYIEAAWNCWRKGECAE
ncbi:MAG: alanine--glyoxylate aminotransferase family protein [Aminobacteriaceae bacterium]